MSIKILKGNEIYKEYYFKAFQNIPKFGTLRYHLATLLDNLFLTWCVKAD
jgi:hypothetical protein